MTKIHPGVLTGYTSTIPRGLGVNINPEVERVVASTYVWRLLSKPRYWTDGSYHRRTSEGFIPLLPLMEFNSEARALLRNTFVDEFWLMGRDTDSTTHPMDAAIFSNEWRHGTNTIVGWPGVRISRSGMAWLDEYIAIGGVVPNAWHIHISKPLDEWLSDYDVFLNWMRRKLVQRPVIVTDVEARTVESQPQKELLKGIVSRGLVECHYLSSVFWSDVYRPNRWGASLVTYSTLLSALGKLWIKAQKEWRNEIASDRSRPAWDLLGRRN